jgi:hypothetical protein
MTRGPIFIARAVLIEDYSTFGQTVLCMNNIYIFLFWENNCLFAGFIFRPSRLSMPLISDFQYSLESVVPYCVVPKRTDIVGNIMWLFGKHNGPLQKKLTLHQVHLQVGEWVNW